MQISSEAAIVALLEERDRPSPVLVAIDGHSAAGKSSLARAVAALRPDATIVQTDDFYRPLDVEFRNRLDAAGGYAQYYDWQRLEAEVLQPLRSGRAARFRKYDWAANALGDWDDVRPEGVILVEGCYSARPELRTYYDAVVVVTASPMARQLRQRQRNDAAAVWLERWDAAERHYFEHHRPDIDADLVVSGE
jgi:uridine kinase